MKTQIVLPDTVFAHLKRAIPIRQRSRFITEAVQARLRALQFQQAVRAAAGSWSDKTHPELTSQTAINRYLARFRARFQRHG